MSFCQENGKIFIVVGVWESKWTSFEFTGLLVKRPQNALQIHFNIHTWIFCICELWSETVKHETREHLREFLYFFLSNNETFVDWNRLKCCKKHHKNAKSELKRLSHNLSTFEVLQIRFAIIQFPGFESTLKAIFNDEIYCIDALSGLNENALLT